MHVPTGWAVGLYSKVPASPPASQPASPSQPASHPASQPASPTPASQPHLVSRAAWVDSSLHRVVSAQVVDAKAAFSLCTRGLECQKHRFFLPPKLRCCNSCKKSCTCTDPVVILCDFWLVQGRRKHFHGVFFSDRNILRGVNCFRHFRVAARRPQIYPKVKSESFCVTSWSGC